MFEVQSQVLLSFLMLTMITFICLTCSTCSTYEIVKRILNLDQIHKVSGRDEKVSKKDVDVDDLQSTVSIYKKIINVDRRPLTSTRLSFSVDVDHEKLSLGDVDGRPD